MKSLYVGWDGKHHYINSFSPDDHGFDFLKLAKEDMLRRYMQRYECQFPDDTNSLEVDYSEVDYSEVEGTNIKDIQNIIDKWKQKGD